MPISKRNPKHKERLLRLLPLIGLFVLVVLLASGLFNKSVMEPKRSYVVGTHVRDFTLPSLTGSGQVTLSSIKGRVVVVNFFASWCENCVIEHQALMKLAESQKVEVIGIAWKDTADKAFEWLKKKGNPYHQIGVDTEGDTTIAFALTGVPETYILDHDGVIAYNYKAPITDDVVNDVIIPMVEHLNEQYAARTSH